MKQPVEPAAEASPGASPAKPKLSPINLGPLPVARINKTLGLELDPGDVILSTNAQRHIRKQSDHEYETCAPFLGLTVTDPTYAGDDFNNDGFELIRRMPDKRGLLVAIRLEMTDTGQYEVITMYPVSQAKIDKRRSLGFLKPLAPQ